MVVMMNRLTYKPFILGLALIGSSIFAPSIQAQHSHSHGHDHSHGHSHSHNDLSIEDQILVKERMLENRRNRDEILANRYRNPTNDTVYVPIQYHLVGDINGDGRAPVEDVFENLCRVNDDFRSQKIQFYLKDAPTYINNDILYDNVNRDLTGYLMDLYRVDDAVNIYIGNFVSNDDGFTTLGYYTGFYDVIYVIRSQMTYASKTLTHELGHLFTLPHPFDGWNEHPCDVLALNNGQTPIDIGGFLVENVARGTADENCQVAADGFCDTEPNYNFGLNIGGCDFTVLEGATSPAGNPCPTEFVDPTGVPLVSVNSDNFMSYYSDNCTNTFTGEQRDAILLDVISRGYDRLDAPTSIRVTSAPTLEWPNATSPALYYDMVNFTWAPATGATTYIFKVERMFNGSPIETVAERVTGETNAWVTLQPNQSYRWTVMPFNESDVCNGYEASETFVTKDFTTGVQDLPANIEASRIMPNPASRADNVLIEIESATQSQATISVLNALGQQVVTPQQLTLVPGYNTQQLEIGNLSAGIYVISIETNSGRITHRLVLED